MKKNFILLLSLLFILSLFSCNKDSTAPQTTNKDTKSEEEIHLHNYSSATCTLPQTCSCGETSGVALGHEFVPATCTDPEICSRCGTRNASALAHQYTPATCNSPKICIRCNQTTGEILEHNYIDNKCSFCQMIDPESLPVGLHEIHIVDGNSRFYKYDKNAFEDTYGNTHIGVHIFGSSYSGVETVVFNLDQKYKTFTGSIVASPKLASCAYGEYYIYVDDQLKYTYINQEKTTPKIDFEIDVENATLLSIRAGARMKPEAIASGYMGCGCIVNTQLTK